MLLERESATTLPTNRALEFITVFLDTVLTGEEDLVKCAHKAYDESLRKYHGWIVRGIFSVREMEGRQNVKREKRNGEETKRGGKMRDIYRRNERERKGRG